MHVRLNISYVHPDPIRHMEALIALLDISNDAHVRAYRVHQRAANEAFALRRAAEGIARRRRDEDEQWAKDRAELAAMLAA